MERLHLDALGVGEARWTGVGLVELPDGGCFIYSGGQEHKNGIVLFLNKHAAPKNNSSANFTLLHILEKKHNLFATKQFN